MQTKRVTANLPEKLLGEAIEATGLGITETLVAGLEAVLRQEALGRAKKLKGKLLLREDEGRRHVITRDR
jgi:hypothetical protein